MSPPDATLISRIRVHASERPDQPALADNRETLSWRTFDAESNHIAHALIREGTEPGDRIAVIGDSSVRTALITIGILKAGATHVPVPTMLAADAIDRIVADSGSKIVFASKKFEALARTVSDTVGGRIVSIDFDAPQWTTLHEFLDDAPTSPLRSEPAPDDEFNIIYSSGTTGTPKGIVISHAMRAKAALDFGAVSFPPGARTLVTTALYSNWTMGALIYTLWAGGTLRFLGKFSPAALTQTVADFEPHNVFLVPVQIDRLLGDPTLTKPIESLPPAMKWSAGSYLAPDAKAQLLSQWAGGLTEIYGMTEGAPFTMLRADEFPDKLNTVGRANPPEDVKIIDEDDQELPVGKRGEIVGRVRSVMKSYNNNPIATDALIWRDSDGNDWFRSGDIGLLDTDGFLQVTDRKKDMIISGGFNIYASDLELVLLSHPDVSEAAVFGVPSPKWGETPAAAIVLNKGATVSESDLLHWTNERLGKLQRLCGLVLIDELPRGSLEKILKRELRDTYTHLSDRS
nr:class I adenylate-forming enzyme family protein [uncultured Hyphomonas sp.]